MSDQDNGITQTPFTKAAVPVPSATAGDQGIGGGLDDPGSLPNGITPGNSPWKDHVTPTPANMEESGPFGNPSRFSTLDGSTHKGANEEATVESYKNTIDRR